MYVSQALVHALHVSHGSQDDGRHEADLATGSKFQPCAKADFSAYSLSGDAWHIGF